MTTGYGVTWPPTLDDCRRALKITETDVLDDDFIEEISDASKAYVERYCNRRFDYEERTYVLDGTGTNKLFMPDWPIVTVTSVYGSCPHYPRHFAGSEQSSELVNANYYIISNVGSSDEAKDHLINIASGSAYADSMGVWDMGYQNYQVKAYTGYQTIPADLYHAAIQTVVYLYQEIKQSRVGLTSKAVDGGSLAYEIERGIPLVIKEVLDRYKKIEA